MPYTVKTEGLNELSRALESLGNAADGIAAQGLYEGARVMADAVRQSVQSIQTARFRYVKNGGQRLPSPEEKAVLENAKIGVAKFRKNGIRVDTSVGIQNSGYGTLNGKTVPVPVIANAINSGTSFMKKQPFVRKAANSGGKKAIAAMTASIEEAFGAMTK